MKIYVLPALSGDCIIIDFDNGKSILIDGGFKKTYPRLREILSDLCKNGKRLEYIVLTHYDRDHVSGLIELLMENGKKGKEAIIPVDHIIYNDFSYLYSEIPLIGAESRKETSFQQLKTFESLCSENGWDDGNKPVISGQLYFGTGYQIRIISPSAEALERCVASENRQQDQSNPISGKLCLDLKDWLDIDAGSELSAINKASLAFEIIFGEKIMLFCGDADMNSYRSLLQPKYDIIKLSHHGTFYGNECFCGEEAVVADGYIVSTNGSGNEHPNRRLLAELLMQPDLKTVYLNYDISGIGFKKYHLLYNTKQQEKYRFKTLTTKTIMIEE